MLHVPPRDPNDPPFETLTPPDGGKEADPEPRLWEQDPYAETDFGRLVRRLLRSSVALGVTIVVIVSFVLAWRARGPSRPPRINVAYEDIVQVRAAPASDTAPAHVFAQSPETTECEAAGDASDIDPIDVPSACCLCRGLRDRRRSCASCRACQWAHARLSQPLFPRRTRTFVRVGDGELIKLVVDGLDLPECRTICPASIRVHRQEVDDVDLMLL
jgi:hypothetical protein